MPNYTIDKWDCMLQSDVLILDTSILVGWFLDSDRLHLQIKDFFENGDGRGKQCLVTISAVVEAWGLLAGSHKNRKAALDLLTWLLQPGSNVRLMPQHVDGFPSVNDTIRTSLTCDCVDALLLHFAGDVKARTKSKVRPTLVSGDSQDLLGLTTRSGFAVLLVTPDSVDPFQPRVIRHPTTGA